MKQADTLLVYGESEDCDGPVSALRAAGIGIRVSSEPGTVRDGIVTGSIPAWVCVGGGEQADQLLTLAFEHSCPTLLVRDPDSFQWWSALYQSGGDIVPSSAPEPRLVAVAKRILAVRAHRAQAMKRETDLQTVVELTQSLASNLDIRSILFTLVSRAAQLMGVARCSIVLAAKDKETGFVIATSDDETLRDLPIRLANYPEIEQVLGSGKALVIRDAQTHKLLEAVREENEAAASYHALALVPMSYQEKPLGVLFFRDHTASSFGDDQIALIQTIANATAIALRNARVLHSLKTETQLNNEALVSAQRRVKSFERYVDFFRSAADGMVVSDLSGRVLFANPRSSEITGYAASDLATEGKLAPLLSPVEGRKLSRLYAGFRRGVYPRRVDVRFRHKNGRKLILSVSFSSLLKEENAVLFTFRDVTAERLIADKLRQTTAFFERVIESSVDAIVSADMTGLVLVFNSAAARIFGYTREQVVGKMNVEKLYPPGVARGVMRRIRGPGFGGENRLEDFRVDMMGSDHTPIAVNISAAFIFDGGTPIGTVGVFTDMREKLRMESRLLSAQEELRMKEKSEAVAQLAGTTAHELNQPLTAILSCAELLGRRVEAGSPAAETAQIIATEAERMAEIVRKIGRITKFETKSYVGGAKILDLERSVDEPPRGGNG